MQRKLMGAMKWEVNDDQHCSHVLHFGICPLPGGRARREGGCTLRTGTQNLPQSGSVLIFVYLG